MRLLIKYKLYFLLLLASVSVVLLINSCKKDNNDTVAYFLTLGKWQLAAVTRQTFVGDTLKRTDTLNITCSVNQVFQFKADNTCSFDNYHCITQSSAGKWQLGSDNLSLQTTMTAKDTLKTTIVTVNAFDNGQIINLGQYSFVVQTGDTSPYYTSKTRRVITRYGFVHPTN